MSIIDLKKVYREHYTASAEPTTVDVPARPFLMIDGRGDPNTATEYREAIVALYPIAYALRAAVEAATGDADTVMPLEGLWWVPDLTRFATAARSDWRWTLMICLPDAVTRTMASDVIGSVTQRKNLVAGARVRVETFPRARRHRSCTSAPTPTRRRASSGCTGSSRAAGTSSRARTTRSICRMRAGRSRRS